MGKTWDHDKGGRDQWIAWLEERMREALRVLKPGAHALVWALPRTSHWTATALENAGFEIRDRLAHIFGSGFPKSLDIGKGIDRLAGYGHAQRWDGWGTALKPAVEDWWLVRKPIKGSIVRSVLGHGTGALNIDACRVEHASPDDLAAHQGMVSAIKARGGTMDNSWANHSDLSGASDVNTAGRWPSHLLLSHAEGCERIGSKRVKAAPAWNDNRSPSLFTGETTSPVHHSDADGFETVDAWQCVEGCPVRMLDEQSGERTSGGNGVNPRTRTPSVASFDRQGIDTSQHFGDSGGASRYFTSFAPFFYTAKATREDREKGCEYLPVKTPGEMTGRIDGSKGLESPRAGAGRGSKRRNDHPTVKSTDLMRWLVRLITLPGGIVLDPFAGSGSTGVACSAEGFRFVGFELSEAYAAIARARIIGDCPLFNVGGL
jgi:site-specific DNA-methyltransferase (adenine-specific)